MIEIEIEIETIEIEIEIVTTMTTTTIIKIVRRGVIEITTATMMMMMMIGGGDDIALAESFGVASFIATSTAWLKRLASFARQNL